MTINWLSVKDKVPEPLDEDITVFPFVLIFCAWHDPGYRIGYYDPQTGWYDAVLDSEIDGVTHWAELNSPQES